MFGCPSFAVFYRWAWSYQGGGLRSHTHMQKQVLAQARLGFRVHGVMRYMAVRKINHRQGSWPDKPTACTLDKALLFGRQDF